MTRFPCPSIALVLVLASSVAAVAAPKVGHATKADAVATTSDSQIDGMCDQIEDNLWAGMDEYFHYGDFARSVALSRIIVQADPGFVECYSTGGWLMESLGNLNDAEAFYQDGIRNNPNSSFAYYNLGFFYFNTLKDYPSAVATFQRDARQSDSNDIDWKMLAHSYERVGDYDDALATWTEVKKRWPASPAVDVNLNRVKAIVAKRHASS